MTAQTMIGFMPSNNEKGLNPMGWLQKLLGKYKTQEVSPFAVDEEYIFHGFDQIMCGVDMPWDVRQFIYDNFITIFQAGDPRGCKKLFIDALDGVEWSWEWYDQSKATFNDFGVYPYMWRQYVCYEINCPPVPTSVGEGAALCTYKKLRQWMKDQNIFLSRHPRSKAELIKVMAEEITWDQFRSLAEQRHIEIIQKAQEKDLKGKAKLLCHTISMSAYNVSYKNRNINFLKYKGLAWGDEVLSELTVLSIVTDEPEKNQQLIRTMFDDGFDNGAGQWPPYFPGDRSSVRHVTDFRRQWKRLNEQS